MKTNEDGAKWGFSMLESETNVLAFAHPRSQPAHHPKTLIETVYAAGSIALPADDLSAKTAAVMLQALGFVVIDEVLADGTIRSLKRGETRQAMGRPWRLSKPPYTGEAGLPDGNGAFKRPV